jgi:hypothetical protein
MNSEHLGDTNIEVEMLGRQTQMLEHLRDKYKFWNT